jgi:hypothetical protein
MNGRWLCRLLVAALLLGAAPRSIGPATPPAGESRLLVTVGETTAGSTQLWLRVESDVARVQVAAVEPPSMSNEPRPMTASTESNDRACGATVDVERTETDDGEHREQ